MNTTYEYTELTKTIKNFKSCGYLGKRSLDFVLGKRNYEEGNWNHMVHVEVNELNAYIYKELIRFLYHVKHCKIQKDPKNTLSGNIKVKAIKVDGVYKLYFIADNEDYLNLVCNSGPDHSLSYCIPSNPDDLLSYLVVPDNNETIKNPDNSNFKYYRFMEAANTNRYRNVLLRNKEFPQEYYRVFDIEHPNCFAFYLPEFVTRKTDNEAYQQRMMLTPQQYNGTNEWEFNYEAFLKRLD